MSIVGSDQALYLNQVTAAYSSLADADRVVFFDRVNRKGEVVAHEFAVPYSAACSEAELRVRDFYILAQLNNLFVTFGGAKLTVYLPLSDKRLLESVTSAVAEFAFDRPTTDRTGFGSFANYMDRINRSAGLSRFAVDYQDIAEYVTPDPDSCYRLFTDDCMDEKREILREAVTNLGGKVFVGLDVGGTGIKASAVVNGEIAALYAYSWHPATFGYTREIVGPIVDVATLMAAAAAIYQKWPEHPLFTEIRNSERQEALPDLLVRAKAVADELAGDIPLLDGLVCGFPDIVINDKVVGGEVYKLRGIRQRDPAGYDADFSAIMNLDDSLRHLCKPAGETAVFNDGFITSYVISAERQFAGVDGGESCCLLVHTIGTEMGTGIICPFGADQDIPIEGYNWIVDLARGEDSTLDADDVRSSVNFNTAVPGTIQKVISQSGLIRLAVKNFAATEPERVDELLHEGLLHWEDRPGGKILAVPMHPYDRRSDLVRRLVAMLRDGNVSVRNAYKEMGLVLGVLVEAMDSMLAGVGHERFVSGGVVADDECFRCFAEGLKSAYPAYSVRRLDADVCSTPLLKKLSRADIGFMSAVGSCYIASKRLLKKASKR